MNQKPGHDGSATGEEEFDFSHDTDGLGYTLHEATKPSPSRSAVKKLWVAIADGKASEATCAAWAVHVARRVKAELIDNYDGNDRQRGTKALQALGMYGVSGKHERARRIFDILAIFDDADQSASEPTVAQVFACLYPKWEGTPKEKERIKHNLEGPIREARRALKDKRSKG